MDPISTVGDLVVERPSRARVFEHFGIDYCCGGRLPLAAACQKQDIDVQTVLTALTQEAADAVRPQRDWSQAPINQLTHHIETTHHAYLRHELPRLAHLTGRVAKRHGDRNPALWQVHEVFMVLKLELESHIAREEEEAFAMCRALERAATAPSRKGASVRNAVGAMTAEHDKAGESLRQLRSLTGDYAVPGDACNSYRAMLAGLAELEADMHRHVHLENHVLFPRAIALEDELIGGGAPR